jgi:hypothetical protein
MLHIFAYISTNIFNQFSVNISLYSPSSVKIATPPPPPTTTTHHVLPPLIPEIFLTQMAVGGGGGCGGVAATPWAIHWFQSST